MLTTSQLYLWTVSLVSALHRPIPSQPEYTILREPPEGEPEFLVMEVKLPKVVSQLHGQQAVGDVTNAVPTLFLVG